MRSYVFGGGDGAPRRIDNPVIPKRNRFQNHGAKWRKALAWAVTAWTLGMAPVVYAHPILDAAGAGVTVSGTTNMNITGEATNNLIKWVDFSIGSGEKVTFDAKNYLNYVTGSARSDILGTLTGGGSIYLVNPNGILIGDGATVNVGSLYLSTKELSAANLADYATATSALSSASIGTGDVINMGKLNATVISVEGNNITFKNVADVKKGGTIGNDGKITGGTQNNDVTLTATGEIHIGSATGGASGYNTSGGTTYNYKLVSTANELQNMKNDLAGNYMLAGNIDAGSIEGFTPIGIGSGESAWAGDPFTGRFDGLNYKVSNLHILVDDDNVDRNAGLFGFNKGTIENLEVAGATVTNETNNYIMHLGAVAGQNQGTLRNVRNTGNIDCSSVEEGVYYFGGIVGLNMGTIDRAYNTGALTGNSDKKLLRLGGIAGKNGSNDGPGVITNAFNTGAITDTGTGSANLNSYVGGIAGRMEKAGSRIENAYNSGTLTSDSTQSQAYLGGIVGWLARLSAIQQTYNSGTLTGKNEMGGIVGFQSDAPAASNVTDSYSTTTGNGGNHNDGNPLTDANKKTQDTYAGFDFSANGAWRIYDGYTMPLLTAFLKRADHDNGTTTYNGTVTGNVGARYEATMYNGVQAQIGGANYINDVSIVTPKDLTVSFDASPDKIYDGTTNATAGEATLTGIVGNDDVSLATGVTAAYEDKNVGTDKQVNYTNVALTGDAAKNYNLTNAATVTGTGTITAKEISATFADVSKVYDGTTDATAGTATLTGVITGDTVNVSGTAAFADKNAGTNKTVNYTGVTLSGTDAANYTIADTATGTGTIDKANLTITSDPVTKTYDGTTNAMGVANIASGTLYDGDIISDGTFAFTDKNAGTNKTVTVSDVTVIDGNNGGNYNVTYAANTTSTINRKDAQVTFKSTTKTYDGTTSATPGEAEFMGVMPADKGKVGMTADVAYEDKNVGTGKRVKYTNITLTGTEAQNYHLTQTYVNADNGTITRRPLWLVANPVTITEGEATPTTWSGNLTGFVAGERLGANDVYFFALDNPAASAAGSYSVTGTLNGDESGNYGQNYTFANAASNATAFTINAYVPPAPEPTPTPKPQDIVETVTENPGAAKEYTDVVASLDSGANTVLPTTNVLPTENVIPTNSVLPTGNNRPTESNQPTGSAQPTESAAQENNSASGEQSEAQEQNGLLPAQQTTGGQPAAGSRESHLGITYSDINMPKSMSVEALAAALNGEPTQQSGAPAASNTPTTEPATQNAPTTEPTSTTPASNGESDEEA